MAVQQWSWTLIYLISSVFQKSLKQDVFICILCHPVHFIESSPKYKRCHEHVTSEIRKCSSSWANFMTQLCQTLNLTDVLKWQLQKRDVLFCQMLAALTPLTSLVEWTKMRGEENVWFDKWERGIEGDRTIIYIYIYIWRPVWGEWDTGERIRTFKIKQEVTETQAWTSLTSTLVIIKQNNDSNSNNITRGKTYSLLD